MISTSRIVISRRNTIIAALLAAVLTGAVSCVQMEKDLSLETTSEATLTLSIDAVEGEQEASTKSSITADTSKVVNFNLWLYNPDGSLKPTGYKKYYDADASLVKLNILVIGLTYQIRVLANVGEVTPPATLSECDNTFTQAWNIQSFNNQGAVPMSGKTHFTAQANNPEIVLHLVRLFAKYTFCIDKSDFTHGTFTLTSLCLKQAPDCCRPFVDSKVNNTTIKTVVGDTATQDDISSINSGGAKTFYLYENLQGDILPSNTDSYKKDFDLQGDVLKSMYATICSYLEIKGNYAGQGLSTEMTFRAYLGEDATSNFDVTRNTAYTVTLVLNEVNGLYKNASWKVDRGTVADNRTLSVPSTLTVTARSYNDLVASVSPSDLQIDVTTDDHYANVKLTSSPGLETFYGPTTFRLTNTENLTEDKTTTLTFKTWDGKKTAQCLVKVQAPRLVSITVSPATASVPKGRTQTFTAIATYDTGDTQVINNDAVWSGDTKAKYDSKSASGAIFKGDVVGDGTVKATFRNPYCSSDSKYGTATLTVRAKEIVSIAVTPGDGWKVNKTDSKTFTATATYTDGTTGDVSSSVTWTSSNSSALSSQGGGVFKGIGIANSVKVTASISSGVEGGGTVSASTTGSVLGISELTLSPGNGWKYNKTNPTNNYQTGTWTLTGKMSDGTTAPADYLNQAVWTCSTHLASVSGHTYKFTATSTDNGAWVKATLDGVYVESKGTVWDEIDYYDAPTGLSISGVGDVPASGGSVTSGTISGTCSQVVHYKSGDTKTLTNVTYTSQWNGGASGVASLGTTAKDRSVVGSKLTLTYTANGKSTTTPGVDVYQAKNEKVSTEQTGTGDSDYTVSISNISKSSGISAEGETVTFKVAASHKHWIKYKDKYTSGSYTAEYDGAKSDVADNVSLSSSQTWATCSSSVSSGSTVSLTIGKNTSAARTVTITAKNSSNTSTSTSASFSQNGGVVINPPGGDDPVSW